MKELLKRSLIKLHKNFGVYEIVKIGQVSEERRVPDHIVKPKYFYTYSEPGNTIGIPEIKNVQQIKCMKEVCKAAANILKACEDVVMPGITTDEIDGFVHSKIISINGYPSPLRYAGFPKSVCTSVNNVVCHGIPDDRKLLDGDIINVDITIFMNGFHGDCSKTFLVGKVDEVGKNLVASTEECLNGAIKLCSPGKSFNVIGNYIEKFAHKKNLSSIPDFIGHGIGSYFHGPPEILHFRNTQPGKMAAGMTFTIEPILTTGSPEIELELDGWTAKTVDNARCAQFEHTLLVTDGGVEILTTPD